ncbi:MAG: hypothetical protein AAFR52_04525, partial [Pseudomonadota bacterium]
DRVDLDTIVRITNPTSTATAGTDVVIRNVSVTGGVFGDASESGEDTTPLFDPTNTDNLQDSSGTESHKVYAAELVTLANGDLVMISSERGTSNGDGISSYKIDNDPTSATYGRIVGTNQAGNGTTDLGAKIDSAGFQSPDGRIDAGYNETADLAAVTLGNGSTFVYSADFNRDAIGITRIEADGSLTETSVLQNGSELDRIKELSIVEVGGQSYLLALSTGGSDRLISYAINDDGSLTQTDIERDGSGADENFLNGGNGLGNASVLESFTNSAGETFVVAGGDDDGISLWTLDETGQVVFQNARADNRAGTGEFDPQGNELSRDVIQPENTGLENPDAAAFGEIGGQTYLFVGGSPDNVEIFRVGADLSGDGTFDLTLVGQTPDIVHDISSMAFLVDGDGGKLVVGGEQNRLEFFDVVIDAAGVVTLDPVLELRDGGDPGAELADSEDIDIVEAILDGRQPAAMTVSSLLRLDALPADWDAQRRMLGIA